MASPEAKQEHDAVVSEIKEKRKIPEDLVLYLDGNLVDTAQIEVTTEADGTVMAKFQAITKTVHNLSGEATHCITCDARYPDKYVYSVHGTGEGCWIADKSNGVSYPQRNPRKL